MEPLEHLKGMIKKNDTIWTDICHTSKYGMKRIVRVFIVNPDHRILRISYLVSVVIGAGYNTNKMGVNVCGCNFDAEAKVVEDLSYALFGDTKSLQQKFL